MDEQERAALQRELDAELDALYASWQALRRPQKGPGPGERATDDRRKGQDQASGPRWSETEPPF